MIICFLEQTPTPDHPSFDFLFISYSKESTTIGQLIYQDFDQDPRIIELREFYGQLNYQLLLILLILHSRDLVTPFITSHDILLEQRIHTHLHHRSPVQSEASLVSEEEIN
jgi:hypothetical protein